MDAQEDAIELISQVDRDLFEWKKSAFDDFDKIFPRHIRPSLSELTIDNFLYDRMLSYANTATTKVPVSIPGPEHSRMRWLQVGTEKFSVAVWCKKIHRRSLLTSNHASRAVWKRREEACLYDDMGKMPLFICGHILSLDVFGLTLKLDRIVLTQEGVKRIGIFRKRVRVLNWAHCLWSEHGGFRPLIPQPTPTLFSEPATEPAINPLRVVIRPKLTITSDDGLKANADDERKPKPQIDEDKGQQGA